VSVPLVLGLAALKIVVLVAFTFVIGGRVIPWLLERAAATKSRELFTLTVLCVVLGIAVGSAKLFDVSMALGAFLAGMVVGRSDFSLRAASEALPMRDAFAVLFFVSVGMLFKPAQIIDTPLLVAGTFAVVMIGKPLAALAIVLWLGYPLRTAIAVSVALAQIGEFSFILADLAVREQILGPTARSVLVAVAIVSITLNPMLYRLVRPMEAWIARRPRLHRWLTRRSAARTGADHPHRTLSAAKHRVIIVGYGPVGRTLTRLLRENGVEPTVIELNLETVRKLRGEGVHAVYGDTGHRDTLINAGVADAGTLILSAAGMSGSAEIIRLAKELNPDIQVLARSTYLSEQGPLASAGATHVFAGEGEVALAMTVAILRGLGATPEQIDRERERIYDDLFKGVSAVDGKGGPKVATAGLTPVLAGPIVDAAGDRPAGPAQPVRPDIAPDQPGDASS
jgi:CPA2 family monovalent cation:H+ antiporter-2